MRVPLGEEVKHGAKRAFYSVQRGGTPGRVALGAHERKGGVSDGRACMAEASIIVLWRRASEAWRGAGGGAPGRSRDLLPWRWKEGRVAAERQ